ncbi:MAG TPA: Hsp20/alpha crystallin family protein [Aggregatilinea sp.]|uniref:Hsp20/alpha crystallin family protein n=1 Tax=Aggregatilinea sp. TaxID=2806333 RepID=UPI002D034896|nr:Hsp20/alpha crystallin family protein [Aggregatilinea sp.]HML24979.1 Hsp20/alpha crystallin family protein [Aggregatilinea sp.]
MARVARWDPIRDMITMRQAMDRAMDESFARGAETRGTGAWLLPMDAYVTEDAIVIRADVPGIAAEDLEILLEGDTLTIRGEIKRDQEENRKYVLLERPTGKFERTLTINTPIDHDKVEASFKDGVLTLTLAKAEAIRPRQIAVKAG